MNFNEISVSDDNANFDVMLKVYYILLDSLGVIPIEGFYSETFVLFLDLTV